MKAINTVLEFALEEKFLLLEVLYKKIDETFSKFRLACVPGCNLCCTNKIFSTSLEAFYFLSGLDLRELERLKGFKVIRPVTTHNEFLLACMRGEEPPQEMVHEDVLACPFLDENGLCRVYERRPLMCRLMVSVKKCGEQGAEMPQFLFKVGTIALQLVENIDQGGIYGNFFELLLFLRDFKEGKAEEIPPQFLNNVDVDELPLLPEEDEERKWVGSLYRTPIPGKDLTFRELLNELRARFQEHRSLTFLDKVL